MQKRNVGLHEPREHTEGLSVGHRWQLHSGGGPVASTVGKLMGEAVRSARLMALLSLQLSKVVTGSPALMPFYADAYVQMLLFGAPVDPQDGTALEVCLPHSPSSSGDVHDMLMSGTWGMQILPIASKCALPPNLLLRRAIFSQDQLTCSASKTAVYVRCCNLFTRLVLSE